MDRKDKILEFINSKEYIPLKIDEIKTVLSVPNEDYDEFTAILTELVNEGKLHLTKRKRYESLFRAGLVLGRLSCNAYGRFGFLIPDDENEEEIYIGPNKFLDAYDSDTVITAIDLKNAKTGKREGHITKVIKRGNERLTGVVKFIKDDIVHITPDSRKIYARISCDVLNSMDAEVGDRVLVEITDYPKANEISGIVIKNLGKETELKSNIEALLEEHSIKQEFRDETLKEAQNAPKKVSQKEMASRLDLRDELIFTIDGDDARDFDDAVSIKKADDGCFILGVHIADVTSYVTDGSALDFEAFERGTSVYLADRVIPMLPVELSNGICSLNPHVNRLCLSVFIKIDENGNAQLEKLAKTVIRSVERMTYNNVAELLENPSEKLLKRYSYLLPTLKQMQELAQILNKKRIQRGSINFDFAEAQIIVNDMGEPTDIIKTERKVSHKMIEEFMLIANETVAELAFWSELPFVYRVHEPPSIEKTEAFNSFIKNFGYSIKGRFDKDNPIHPKAFGQVLDKISGTDEEIMISTYMLRSLMKAEYNTENLGHFGLAAKYYCHFTSPIRRYPDLMIHRILKSYLDGKDTLEFSDITKETAINSSKKERDAEYCERDVEDLMKAAFMQKHIGEEFKGIVSSVTNFGMFVRLENTVEGLIRLDTMKDDFYEFDETSRTIVGKRRKRAYKIGDHINVITVKCDLLSRSVDFIRSEDESVISNFERKQSKNSFRKKAKHTKKGNYARKRRKVKRNGQI